MIINGLFEKIWVKIVQSLPLEKASNKQFQREGEVTQQWLNLVSKCRHENKYINELLINSQTYCNLSVIFICNVICIYQKLFEKINITSEGLSKRHETQCNVKSEVFNCLMTIVVYGFTLKYWALSNNFKFITNNNK